MEKDYNLYIEYEEIYLKGNVDETTDFEIYIEETNRNVTVKVPNTIKPYENLKLKGLGKKKLNGNFGDLYIRFSKVYSFSENEKCFKKDEDHNRKKAIKYKYKYVTGIYLVDDTIQEYSEDGWRCINIQPIINRLDPYETYDKTIEYRPDYEFNILFEREIAN